MSRPCDYTGEPETCLWCGRKFPRKHIEDDYKGSREAMRQWHAANPPPNGSFYAEDWKNYEDRRRKAGRAAILSHRTYGPREGRYGYFDTLDCAYRFATQQAHWGQRCYKPEKTAELMK